MGGSSGTESATTRPGPYEALRWPGLLLAVVVAPFVPVLAGRSTLAWRDTMLLHLPLRAMVSDALRAGRLPLWNPHEALGKPLLADALHGVLHPLSLLAAALDPGGTDLLTVLYLASAALGAWVLARELDLAAPAAFVAGVAYALSGYVLSMAGAVVFLAGASSLPWQVAALAACGRGARHGVALVAAATAGGVLSGDAQMVIVGALLGGALAVERGGWRVLPRASLGLALGAAVAGVQLVPSALQLLRSSRVGGISAFGQRTWSLSPFRLPELVSPGLFYRLPSATAEVFTWLAGGTMFLPFGASLFVGVPTVALAAAAPFRQRRVRLLTVAALLLLWLAFGHYAGAMALTSHLPVWRSFRYTEKLVVPLSLTIALLAALGLGGRGTDGPPVRRLAIGLGAGALVAPLLWMGAELAAGFGRTGSEAVAHALALRSNVSAGLGIALGGAALAAAALLARRAATRTTLIALAVGASLLMAVPFACHFGDPGAVRGSPLAALPFPPPVARLSVPEVWEPTTGGPGFDAVDATNGSMVAAAGFCWSAQAGLDNFDTYGPFVPDRFAMLPARMGDTAPLLFRHFAGTHVVLRSPAGKGDRASERWVAGGQAVYENPQQRVWVYAVPHRPWARFARAVATVGDASAARARLLANLAEMRDEVVVEGAGQVPAGTGTVLAQWRGREEVAIDVEAQSDGLLVVNDAYWPGWKAWIDGTPTRVLPADVLARGVEVPAGRHRVTLRYEPEEVRWGLALSALGLVVLLASSALTVRRRRAEP